MLTNQPCYIIPEGKTKDINFDKAIDIAKGMNAIVENLGDKASQDDQNDFYCFYLAIYDLANGRIELDLYQTARKVSQKFQEPETLSHLFPKGSVEMYNTLFSPIFMLPLVKEKINEKTEMEDITHSVNAVALKSPKKKKKPLLFRKENKSPPQAAVECKDKKKPKKTVRSFFKKK